MLSFMENVFKLSLKKFMITCTKTQLDCFSTKFHENITHSFILSLLTDRQTHTHTKNITSCYEEL